MLTPDEEYDLGLKAGNGCADSCWKLVTAYMPKIQSSAHEAVRSYGVSKDHVDDLISELALAVFKKARTYNPERARFVTYINWTLYVVGRDYCKAQSHGYTIPYGSMTRMNRLRAELHRRRHTGEPIDPDTLAQELSMTPTMVETLMHSIGGTLSLDMSVRSDGEHSATRGELMIDESVVDPVEYIEIVDRLALLAQAVDELQPREREIFMRRTPGGSLDAETLESIAGDFGVTKERIRQIQVAATKKVTQKMKSLAHCVS